MKKVLEDQSKSGTTQAVTGENVLQLRNLPVESLWRGKKLALLCKSRSSIILLGAKSCKTFHFGIIAPRATLAGMCLNSLCQ